MAYERSHVQDLLGRLDHAATFLICVTGPRQSGKTTTVRQALRRLDRPSIYLPIENPRAATVRELAGERERPLPPDVFPDSTAVLDARGLMRAWDTARAFAAHSPRGAVLALDDIQMIDNWTATVKGLWDADRREGSRLRVVLLGPVPPLMQPGLTESMTGRFQIMNAPHWSFGEMAGAFGFGVQEYVYFGGYPGTAMFIDAHEYGRKDIFGQSAAVPEDIRARENAWREYVRKAIAGVSVGGDTVALHRVEKPALMAQLFHLGCAYSGQALSYQSMLGQFNGPGNVASLRHYLELLSTAGLISRIERCSGNARSRAGASPKLNVRNTALMSSSFLHTFAGARADGVLWGRLTKSAVGAHLCNASSSRTRCCYWQHNGSQIDFVLRGARRTVAVEIQSGKTPRKRRGFNAFREQYPEAELLPVGGRGVPLEEFFSTPPDHWVAGAPATDRYSATRARAANARL